MTRKCPVRFLGGGTAAMSSCYPTTCSIVAARACAARLMILFPDDEHATENDGTPDGSDAGEAANEGEEDADRVWLHTWLHSIEKREV